MTPWLNFWHIPSPRAPGLFVAIMGDLSGMNVVERHVSLTSIRLSDGPNGVRGTKFFNSVPAACFPCGTALAATWNVDLLRKAGATMGAEARAKGVHVLLGPTVNIQLSPLGGRGFESFSEDTVLAGRYAAAIVAGIEETGVTACIKHFVANILPWRPAIAPLFGRSAVYHVA